MAPPNEETLLEYMKSSIQTLQGTQQLDNKGRKVLKWLRKLKCANYSPRTRFIAAQWMIVYHTVSAMNIQTDQQLDALQKQTQPDMKVAWNLLDCEHPPDQELNAHIFMLDVAQRLEDPVKLHVMFTDLASREPIPYQAAMVAFTVAPTLGDWKQFMKLGKMLQEESGMVALEQFHMMSAQMGMPDFFLIYKNVEETGLCYSTPTPHYKSLVFESLDFEKVAFTFKGVKCEDDEEKQKEVAKQLEKEEKHVEMDDLPKKGICFKIAGSLVNMQSISEVPIVLAGPYVDSDHLRMEGYHDLLIQPVDGQMSPEAMQMAQMGMTPEALQMQIEMGTAAAAGGGGGGGGGMPGPMGASPLGGPGQMHPAMLEQMKKFNEELKSYTVRQHEIAELRKCSDGYKGAYTVKNFKPYLKKGEKDTEKMEITYDIHVKCRHPSTPQNSSLMDEEEKEMDSQQRSPPVETFVTAIDGLTLD